MGNSDIRKTYNLADLICTREALERRCLAIETFTSRFGPEVRFEFGRTTLTRVSRRIPAGGSRRHLAPCQRDRLARLIDKAHVSKLVHGDICPKNLIISGDNLYILDWEPCLRQVRAGGIRFVVTPPCFHPCDRLSGSITVLTDLMGLARFWPGQTALSASRLASAALNENRQSPAAALALALDIEARRGAGAGQA